MYSTDELNVLFLQACNGCNTSAKVIYEVCRKLIYKNFKRHLGRDDLEDLMHNTFRKILKNNKFDASKSCFASWFLLLARQECFDLLRKKYRSKKHQQRILESQSAIKTFSKKRDDLVINESMQQVLRICAASNSDLQPFFYLHFYRGMTIDQCSIAMQIPIGTLKTRATRIYRKIRVLLGDKIT